MTSNGRINPRMDERIIIAVVKQADVAVQPENFKTSKKTHKIKQIFTKEKL
jgi:hypothetical protein